MKLKFKFLVIDAMDWVSCEPGMNPKIAFKKYHHRAPSHKAKYFVCSPNVVEGNLGGPEFLREDYFPIVEIFPKEENK